MLRNFWFQLHWLLGITAGTLLSVVGVTGGLLSFEHELLHLINADVMNVVPRDTPRLTPDELVARVKTVSDRPVLSISLAGEPDHAATVIFAADNPAARGGELVFFDPYTGEVLGKPRGKGFFSAVMGLHRWLLAGEAGKQLVGASTVALLVLSASGLYLRWPRRFTDLRRWLTFHWSLTGRAFLWNLHSVIGTWMLPLYILASITGLYWSYDWYRTGMFNLAGVERPARLGPPGREPVTAPLPEVALDTAWQAFNGAVPAYSTVRMQLPRRPGEPLSLSYMDPDAPHERAFNQMRIEPTGGAVLEHRRYADKSLNEKLMGSMLPLHSGSFFGTPVLIAMMLASLAMPLFTITGWMLYLDRRKRQTRNAKCQQASANSAV
ncbi:MAG: PepSY domain-containing protein [Gammaproteobacteria bacterium]|jgi:sulfite reductase (NADPH) flavoprotein alpha-component|nr:PepSY domain-containing protein [Gammaproteobacteria bacterium]